MRAALALFFLTLLSFSPHFDYPEWRGTEARRVQIANEMVQSGDYIVPRLWGAETYAKPPFYYWVLAGSIHVFGLERWSMRLPSVLAFFVLALVAFRLLRRWHDEPTAWLGAAGVLLSPVAMFDAPFAEIDPMFSVLTALSLLFLCDGVLEQRRGRLILAGVLGGLAVMTKGPPYLMFFVGPFVIWWKRSHLRGLMWYAPWVIGFYAIYKLVLDSAGTAADVTSVAAEESLGRLAFWTPKALKAIPEHVARCVLLFGLPFSCWLLPWVRRTRRQGDVASMRQNFLVWGAISGMAVLLFSKGKSTRYLLPAVPMLMFGLAPLVAESLRRRMAPALWVQRALSVFGVLAAVAAMMIAWLPFPYPGTTGIALLALASICWFVHSERRLVHYAMAMPLVIAWCAIPDRVNYFANAGDFAPDPAAVLARELKARSVRAVGTFGNVGTSLLLHTSELCDGLSVHGDPTMSRVPDARWLVVQDRGYVKYAERSTDVIEVPGYRVVMRVQMGPKKSVSLREKL